MHRLLRDGQRIRTPGDGFRGTWGAGWGARRGPRRGQAPSLGPYRRALRPARADGPGHCLRGTPVRTHCFGCFQLARAPPGPSQGSPRRPAPFRPPPTAERANAETCRRSHPTFQEQPPTQPPTQPPGPLRRAPLSRPREGGGLPRPQAILTGSMSECDGQTQYTPGARPTPSLRWKCSEAGWGGGAREEPNREWGWGGGRGGQTIWGGGRDNEHRRLEGGLGGRRRGEGEAPPKAPRGRGGAPPLPAAPAPRPFPRSAAAGTELTPHERAEV